MNSTTEPVILPRCFQRFTAAAILIIATSFVAAAGQGLFLGRPVADVIEEFRAAGHPIVWSTNL
ncbi:MAG: hypothetical protein ACREIV_06315, partial [Planctomycetaceae bacterium]